MAEALPEPVLAEYWRGRYDQLLAEFGEQGRETHSRILGLETRLKYERARVESLERAQLPLLDQVKMRLARALPWRQHTYWNLPREARDACDRFCLKIPEFTRADYLAHYDWDNRFRF